MLYNLPQTGRLMIAYPRRRRAMAGVTAAHQA